jgi:hypothetical protein
MRDGTTFGYQNEVPDMNINKYAGKKEGGAIRTDLQRANKQKTDHGDMKLFKKGGNIMEKESKVEERKEMKEDVAQDKKLIKKAFKMHDKQEHKGQKGTNLTKLCRGGGIEIKGKTKGRNI